MHCVTVTVTCKFVLRMAGQHVKQDQSGNCTPSLVVFEMKYVCIDIHTCILGIFLPDALCMSGGPKFVCLLSSFYYIVVCKN